jgi:uncharacterized UPF0146 family protein
MHAFTPATIKTSVNAATRDALVGRLSDYASVVEIGIGRRPGVARQLASTGTDVTATDIEPRDVPTGIQFVVDDVTDPNRAVYADADALYALNCPPELHRPMLELASVVDADCLFTTLGADQPAVPVTRETLPGETLFRAAQTDRSRPTV